MLAPHGKVFKGKNSKLFFIQERCSSEWKNLNLERNGFPPMHVSDTEIQIYRDLNMSVGLQKISWLWGNKLCNPDTRNDTYYNSYSG